MSRFFSQRRSFRLSAWYVCLTLLLPLFLLSSCTGPAKMIQPFRFYYLASETNFSSPEGIIRCEGRDLGTKIYSNRDLFRLYMAGPYSDSLISPFSMDAELTGVYRVGSTLELRLTAGMFDSGELKHTLAFACLAKTALELDGVRKVHIHVNNSGGDALSDMTLTQGDLLLFDSGEIPEFMEMTLYYTDKSGQLLLPEKRQLPIQDSKNLPQTALDLLLTAPETPGLRSALPSGTAILDLSVEDGVCTVDFNGDFFNNRPDAEQSEQLAVLSVVNTLCELDGINQVLIYAEGRALDPYVYLDLSAPWIADGNVTGPIREELGEFLGTLCLPGQDSDLLHRLQIRATVRGAASREMTLLLSLLERSSQNGLRNPLAGMEAPLGCSTDHNVCRLNFADGQLPAEELEREIYLRCIIGTLCSLPWIDAVEIRENGSLLTPQPRMPSDDWFFVQSPAQ